MPATGSGLWRQQSARFTLPQSFRLTLSALRFDIGVRSQARRPFSQVPTQGASHGTITVSEGPMSDLADSADECLELADSAGLRRAIKFGLLAAIPFYGLVAAIVWFLVK